MTETLSEHLGRVRLTLRRLVMLRAAWLSGVEDGPRGEALVGFIMGDVDPAYETVADVAEFDDSLLPAAAFLPDPRTVGRRFRRLSDALNLSALEEHALWIVLAPEFDHRFLSSYRLLWGDGGRRYCDLDFVTMMLAPHGPWQLSGLFDDDSVLAILRVISVAEDAGGARIVRVVPRIMRYLSGDDRLPADLRRVVSDAEAQDLSCWHDYALAPLLAKRMDVLIAQGETLLVQTSPRTGLDVVLAQSAATSGRSVLLVEMAEVLKAEQGSDPSVQVAHALLDDDGRLLRGCVREARLRDAILHFRGAEAMGSLTDGDARRFAALVADERQPVVVECAGEVPSQLLRHLLFRLGSPVLRPEPPSSQERRDLWNHLSDGALPRQTLAELASIPASPSVMALAWQTADNSGEDVSPLTRRLMMRGLPSFATRVDVGASWSDVVLGDEEGALIDQIRAFTRHYDTVMRSWGLGKRSGGRGIKVLFSGPSGTGKTLTAGLIAQDALRDLYRVDVSSIMSKWVGETEKHLATLFARAHDSGAALLFDEADSLFQQRRGGGGDRFGSQLVNFLLEAIEAFDGMVILTTNFAGAIDSAFARRLNYHVKFKVPDQAQRETLWRVHLGSGVPLAPDVDLDALGEVYELTGGEIFQVTIRAAVTALRGQSEVMTMAAIETAIASLYVEKGRLPPARISE